MRKIPPFFIKPIALQIASFPSKRFLLAFSGGADSMLLLHALLALREKTFFDLGVAHVDHGWREESKEEALRLQKMSEGLGLKFYLKTLDPKALSGNLEEASRIQRLEFFKAICESESYSALFLAHHQDDLAETVLKRILEGASFHGIASMRPYSPYEGLALLRPWLSASKEDIIKTLDTLGLSYIKDSTNEDPRFLRGKMRKELFPDLERQFGKSIKRPLARLGKQAQEMQDFMSQHLSHLLQEGDSLDVSSLKTPFEIRWIVRDWAKRKGVFLSYEMLERTTTLLLEGTTRCKIEGTELSLNLKKLHL